VITNPKGYGVQVGSFSHIFNALKLCRELTEQGFTKLIILSEKETNQFYKVYIGEFSQEEETSPIQLKLREKNKDYLVKKYP
jgi:cell division septation protein DedD